MPKHRDIQEIVEAMESGETHPAEGRREIGFALKSLKNKEGAARSDVQTAQDRLDKIRREIVLAEKIINT